VLLADANILIGRGEGQKVNKKSKCQLYICEGYGYNLLTDGQTSRLL
jgi:hypothetical protein